MTSRNTDIPWVAKQLQIIKQFDGCLMFKVTTGSNRRLGSLRVRLQEQFLEFIYYCPYSLVKAVWCTGNERSKGYWLVQAQPNTGEHK